MPCRRIVLDMQEGVERECGEATSLGYKYCDRHLKDGKGATMPHTITVKELAEVLNLPELSLKEKLKFVSLEDILTQIRSILSFAKRHEILKGDETVDEILSKL